MANQAAHEDGLARARAKESYSYKTGKGSAHTIYPGVIGTVKKNPTKGGGINAPTQSGMKK